MQCPRCHLELVVASWGEPAGPLPPTAVPAERPRAQSCERCGGVWLDAEASARLRVAREPELMAHATRAAERASNEAPIDTAPKLACPSCAEPLARVCVAKTLAIDVCATHGTWFDAGEIARLGAALDTDAARAPTPAGSAGAEGSSAAGAPGAKKKRGFAPADMLAAVLEVLGY